jgi:hypothetical protein
VGVVKRRVLRGLWRRLVGVGIIGAGLYGAPALLLTCTLCEGGSMHSPLSLAVGYNRGTLPTVGALVTTL